MFEKYVVPLYYAYPSANISSRIVRPNLDSLVPQQPVAAVTKAVQAVVVVDSAQVDMAAVLWQPEVLLVAAVKSMWPTFVKSLHFSLDSLMGPLY